MKKSAFTITILALTLMVLGHVSANQSNDLFAQNIIALEKTGGNYAQKVLFMENIEDYILIDEQWVHVSFIRTTTVDCTGDGEIPCLKGDVVISDLKIIE